jgi:hypothetical protein
MRLKIGGKKGFQRKCVENKGLKRLAYKNVLDMRGFMPETSDIFKKEGR